MIIHIASKDALIADCGQSYVMNVHELVTYPDHVNCEDCIVRAFQVVPVIIRELDDCGCSETNEQVVLLLDYLDVLAKNYASELEDDPTIQLLMGVLNATINKLKAEHSN